MIGALEVAGFQVEYADATADGLFEHRVLDGHTVAYGLSAAKTIEAVAAATPRFVLITSMFTFEQRLVNDLIMESKRLLSGVPVIVGGIHATLRPEWHFEEAVPDFIVVGEGEETIVDLVSELMRDDPDPRRIPGIAFRGSDGRVYRTAPRTRLRQLDRPWALGSVLQRKDGTRRYSDRMCRKHPVYVSERVGEDVGTFSFYGSRGCRSRCEYCPTTARDGAHVRHMSADHMFGQFMTARKDHDVRVFANQADNFAVRPEGLEFLRRVRDYRNTSGDRAFVMNNPNAFFLHQFFPAANGFQLDTAFLELLEGSGFNTVTVAVETLAPRFNRKVNWTKIRPQSIFELCDEIRRRRMKSDVYMMFGFPDQAVDEFDQDVAFGAQLLAHADLVSWNGVTLLPGTAYYERHVANKPAVEAEYRRTMRSGYAWHFPIEKFNLSRVPTERFRTALAPFGRSWL